MNVLDRVRIERAVLAYDFWLDLRGTPRRRRRDLRRELRSNLCDAAARTGVRAAIAALGSTRQMARESGAEDRTRPRWVSGLNAAAVTLFITVNLGFFAAFAWFDGARAADPTEAVSGSITFFPGSTLTYTRATDGFSLGWLPFAAMLLVFLVVARPWRLLTTGRSAPRTAAQTST
jgi:hypothetical protein